MTDRARPDTSRDTNTPNDPLETELDPGALIGSRPERQAETIPGGVRPEDERIAATHSQAAGSVDDRDAG